MRSERRAVDGAGHAVGLAAGSEQLRHRIQLHRFPVRGANAQLHRTGANGFKRAADRHMQPIAT